jgi:hypothetical protein
MLRQHLPACGGDIFISDISCANLPPASFGRIASVRVSIQHTLCQVIMVSVAYSTQCHSSMEVRLDDDLVSWRRLIPISLLSGAYSTSSFLDGSSIGPSPCQLEKVDIDMSIIATALTYHVLIIHLRKVIDVRAMLSATALITWHRKCNESHCIKE